MRSTAEKNNIPWREMTKEILESDVYKELDSIQNESLLYPDCYLNPFHAYDEGNLTWLAAAEAEAATKSMVRRAIPTASSVDEATQILRGNWLNAIEQHHRQPHTNFLFIQPPPSLARNFTASSSTPPSIIITFTFYQRQNAHHHHHNPNLHHI